MLQRNTSGSPLIVMTNPPQDVSPGETIEHDELLGGFEPVDAVAGASVDPVTALDAAPDAVSDASPAVQPEPTAPATHEAAPPAVPPAAPAWPPVTPPPPPPGSVVTA